MRDGSGSPGYGPEFYRALSDGTRRSAAIVVPALMRLLAPASVVDFGCGSGAWLDAFRRRGVVDILGLDGPWLGAAEREIPEALFQAQDLAQPVVLQRRFDVALCLEVAEHLPEAAAPQLVQSLTRAAPVVIFSAAIPAQGGTDHVNEQWPSYWVRLFEAHGYGCLAGLRRQLWSLPEVEVWYRQNLLCFAVSERLAALGELLAEGSAGGEPLDVVHPDLYLRYRRELDGLQGHSERQDRYCRNLEQQAETLRAERDRLQAELAGIKASRAWRFCQAMRPAVRLVRRGRAALRAGATRGAGI
jgi:hypothetical protein